MAIDFDGLAKERGYDDSKALFTEYYETRRLGLSRIASMLGCSEVNLRVELLRLGFTIHTRGGPNHVKLAMTDELFQACCERGVASVARERDLNYDTLYANFKRRKARTP